MRTGRCGGVGGGLLEAGGVQRTGEAFRRPRCCPRWDTRVSQGARHDEQATATEPRLGVTPCALTGGGGGWLRGRHQSPRGPWAGLKCLGVFFRTTGTC